MPKTLKRLKMLKELKSRKILKMYKLLKMLKMLTILKMLKISKQKEKNAEKQKKAEENFQERMAKKNANSKSRIKSASSYAGRTKKYEMLCRSTFHHVEYKKYEQNQA